MKIYNTAIETFDRGREIGRYVDTFKKMQSDLKKAGPAGGYIYIPAKSDFCKKLSEIIEDEITELEREFKEL